VIVGGSFAVQAMALATGIIMARLLGVEGRGQIALVAAVSALVAKLTLGGSLPVAIAQLLARDGLRARDALRPFVGRWTLLGVACGAVAAGYLFWVLRDEAAGLRLGLTAGVAVMTFQMIVGGILSGALQGEVASASRLVVGGLALQAPFFLTLVTLFALGWEGDAAELVGLQVTTTVLGIHLSWRLLRPSTGTGPALDRGEVRSVTRANYVNAVGSINGVGLDRNLVGGLLGTAPLGLYSTATAVANMSTIVGTAVSTVLLPRLSAAHDQPEQRRRLLRQWLPATAILMLMIVAGLQLVVGPVIEVAFGAEFAPAVELNFSSCDAPINTNPPAVTIPPPNNCVPVLRCPLAASYGYSPNGIFHTSSPVFKSTAFNVPHGGFTPGNPS
jgi:O-antigen/teichoic acid export membrane protein